MKKKILIAGAGAALLLGSVAIAQTGSGSTGSATGGDQPTGSSSNTAGSSPATSNPNAASSASQNATDTAATSSTQQAGERG